MKNFLIALQFLTILPVNIKSEIKSQDFGKSLLYFPLVGVLIGLFLSAVSLTWHFLPQVVSSALIILASIIISGAIHLDGFADTCDGFYGARTKAKMLEIMRDSHIGVMGVSAIACVLLLKFSLILAIQKNFLSTTLILMTASSRWSQSFACSISNYARRNGKAKYFIEYARKKDFFMGTLFIIGLFLLLMKLKGLIVLATFIPLIFLCINYLRKRIGGMTGDTIGATNEIAEVLILLICLFYQRLII
ncbi:MAG: adenosylcobinamide-GDP ribazoletransferase [Omnitrophica bacterium]|nr:adenosylcobinamide-GDP ribazoletransferase [Candidatus Omnitrophota bacterium]